MRQRTKNTLATAVALASGALAFWKPVAQGFVWVIGLAGLSGDWETTRRAMIEWGVPDWGPWLFFGLSLVTLIWINLGERITGRFKTEPPLLIRRVVLLGHLGSFEWVADVTAGMNSKNLAVSLEVEGSLNNHGTDWSEPRRHAVDFKERVVAGDQFQVPLVREYRQGDLAAFGWWRDTDEPDIGKRLVLMFPSAMRCTLVFSADDAEPCEFRFVVFDRGGRVDETLSSRAAIADRTCKETRR